MTDFRSDPRAEQLDHLLEEAHQADPEAAAGLFRQISALLDDFLRDFPESDELEDLRASMDYNLGNIHSARGELDQAELCYRRALPRQQKLVEQHPESAEYRNHLARCRFNLGNVCLSCKRNEEAAEHFFEAQELWAALIEADPLPAYRHDLARAHFNRAYVLSKPRECVHEYRQAQEIWENLLEELPDWPEPWYDLGRSYFNLGITYHRRQSLDNAGKAFRRAVPAFERLVTLRPDVPAFQQDLLHALDTVCQDYLRQRRVGEALATYLRATRWREQFAAACGDDPRPWLALGQGHLHFIEDVLFPANRADDVGPLYRRAITAWQNALAIRPEDETRHMLAVTWFDLGIRCWESQLWDEAEESYRRAQTLWEELTQRHPEDTRFSRQLAATHNQLGLVYRDIALFGAAERHLRQAIAMRQEQAAVAPDDQAVATSLGGGLCNLGNVLLDRQEFEAARQFYEQSVAVLEAVLARSGPRPLAENYLKNARAGLAEVERCSARGPLQLSISGASTMAPRPPGPPPRTSGPTENLYDQADQLRASGQDSAALEVVERLLAEDPRSAPAWYLRGLILGRFLDSQGEEFEPFDRERTEQAVESFTEALLIDPDFYEARLYKGITLRRLAEAAQAHLRALSDLATRELGEEKAREYLGPSWRYFRGCLGRAREALERAAQLRPDEPAPREELPRLEELSQR